MNPYPIEQALVNKRYETARRLCEAAHKDVTLPPAFRRQIPDLHHKALRALGQIDEALTVLQQAPSQDPDEQFARSLKMAEDFHIVSRYDFYRDSKYEKMGITGEEYEELMQKEASRIFAETITQANTAARKTALAEVLRKCRRATEADQLAPRINPETPPPPPPATGTGSLSGRLTFADGSPASQVLMTLGLAMTVKEQDPATYLAAEMHYAIEMGPLEALTTTTDDKGQFHFVSVPPGRHEFLSCTLDPEKYNVHLRFLAQGIDVQANRETTLNLTVTEWQSAAPVELKSPFPKQLVRDGVSYSLVAEEKLRNPFHYNFPRQELRLSPPPSVSADAVNFLLLDSVSPDTPMPFQRIGNELLTFTDLPPLSHRILALYVSATPTPIPATGTITLSPEADGRTAIIDTGLAQFRIPWAAGVDATPPLLAVKGVDGIWRGQGRLKLPAGITVVSHKTSVLIQGPLLLKVQVAYQLSTGASYTFQFTAHQGEAYLLARETTPPLSGAAFEFSLREFAGGRGFLHWTPEEGGRHWSNLDANDRLLARLQEQTPWWVPPQGFGYAMTAGTLASRDYIGVFTIRRGEWIDREFHRLSQGPGDTPPERRELDWPFPEMVGSTISMITAHTSTDGDAFFRFGFFDGERQWGILVSDFECNDGPFKEIGLVQHKNSSPRLNEFKRWRLDEQDHVIRPFVVARREALIELRRKRTSRLFAPVWARIEADQKQQTATAGLRAIVGGDAVTAWRRKREIVGVAHIRSRMTLLGREFADMYSPVGARPITPWAEDYDLLAATGVFSADEERLVRSFLMLVGHLFSTRDFMNWNFNSRNANFEADRVDVVGAIGLVFHGNPDADEFVRHANRLMEQSIRVYCTPDSGKWYENPACYYLHASKCRMNLVFHLASHGVADPTDIPRLKDYLRWGILLLTPECPSRMENMRDGTTDYEHIKKVRRVSPIGDHAHLGPWVPEYYALMSKLYRKKDPAFADLLLWAYLKGGSDGGYFGNIPLFFAAMTEADLVPPPPQTLASRRLQGFGAAFRGAFNTPKEFYLLLKQGPGGYRYHRTEGSIILFSNGKPLIYDGGERGETWRHTTLSFHDVHMPLAPGHVERFHSFAALDFCQGVHPKALSPGEPNFLNDKCNHELEAVAYQRYAEPNPADVRSVIWIKDDYVILHDALNLPANLSTHWHLQAVSDEHTVVGKQDYRFKGRFGTDLQVLLPDQDFLAASVDQPDVLDYPPPPQKRFSLRHLQLDALSPESVLAILRPMPNGVQAIAATLLRQNGRGMGAHVTGDGIEDDIFLGRDPLVHATSDLEFAGRYGAVLRRKQQTTLALVSGSRLCAGGLTLESDGPAVTLSWNGKQAMLAASGRGTIKASGPFKTVTLNITEKDGLVEQSFNIASPKVGPS